MKAVITVIGDDKVGIIGKVATELSNNNINIVDISQTILQDYFTMIMIVEFSEDDIDLKSLINNLNNLGEEVGVSIKVQHEEIFDAMHKI